MWFVNGLKKTAEGFALKLTSEIDWCALSWILNCSDEDKELELFFASIPDSSCLKAVNNVANTSSIQLIEKMTEALIGFVHRTLTSNLVAQEVKRRRLDICRKAMIKMCKRGGMTFQLPHWHCFKDSHLGFQNQFKRFPQKAEYIDEETK